MFILKMTGRSNLYIWCVTIITQDAILSTFDRILNTLTLTVAGIAAISLAVAGILIMNVMLIAVSQRTTEIGLIKALGATRHQIMRLFLAEAIILSITGAFLGLIIAFIGVLLLAKIFPNFPILIPSWAVAISLGVSLLTGLVFGKK